MTGDTHIVPDRPTDPTPGAAATAAPPLRPRQRAELWILAAGMAVALAIAVHLTPFIPDDSYISFRYAEHLAEGHGLRFNTGDPPVEGFTSLLWILASALLHRVGLALPVWAPRLGLLLCAAHVAVVWLAMRHRGAWPQLVATLIAAVATPLLLYAGSGMETLLYAFLLVLSMWLAERAALTQASPFWWGWAAACLALTLTRPEGVIALPIQMVWIALLQRQRPGSMPLNGVMRRAATIALLAGIAAYHLWRIDYFGEVFPTPLLSKSGGGVALAKAWHVNSQFFFVRHNGVFAPMGYYFLTLAFAGALGCLQGRLRVWTLGFLAVAAAHAALYVNFIDWMPGMRYFAPLAGLLAIAAATAWTTPLTPALRFSRAATLALVVLHSLIALPELKLDGLRNEVDTQRSLVALGRWLRVAFPEDAVLAMSDVGATPYYSRLSTIDINPESLTDIRIARDGWSIDYFYERLPDIVIFVSFDGRRPKFYGDHGTLYREARFDDHYRWVGTTLFDETTSQHYWVFARRPMFPSRAALAVFPTGKLEPAAQGLWVD